MHDDIKEIHISVRTHKDRLGNPSAASIYLCGKPIAKGVYTATELPPGWSWEKFAPAALRNEGHGIAVFRHSDKKSRGAAKEVSDSGQNHTDAPAR